MRCRRTAIAISVWALVWLSAPTQGQPLRKLRAQRQEAQLPAAASSVDSWLGRLDRVQPKAAPDYARQNVPDLVQAAGAIEDWCSQLARFENAERPGQVLLVTRKLLEAKSRVDRQLESVIAQRKEFVALQDDADRQKGLLNYLATCSTLIDLSGRLRYLLFDALHFAADEIVVRPGEYEELLDLLIEERCGIGAVVVSVGLFDPPKNNPDGAVPVGSSAKRKILRLIAVCGQYELRPEVARFIRDETSPPLVLAAAETLRQIGLSQEPRPGQDAGLPKPAITARELAEILRRQNRASLGGAERRRIQELLAWCEPLAKAGIADSYRLGSTEIRHGDWLLMRNPSPYNLFTDLSPGLFTHVGVAAVETGSDGVRRLVIVDIPERQPIMPATNVDAFVARTRHFVFLRHPEAPVAKALGDAAAATIGNSTEFDLNFRTERIEALKGKPLRGEKIHTYCAGFLALCALQTNRAREEFFPLPEGPAGGRTRENLAELGFTFGDKFVSPTGAFFSPKLELVGRREPMYDPGREIEEAVFDHFARCLLTRQARLAPDTFQALRMKVAAAAKGNPILSKALAGAAGVAEDADLVAAARAAVLVEALDEVAFGASRDYAAAREAILDAAAPASAVPSSREEQERARRFRVQHRELIEQIQTNRLSPRGLRQALVKHYSDVGQRAIEARFFAATGDKESAAGR